LADLPGEIFVILVRSRSTGKKLDLGAAATYGKQGNPDTIVSTFCVEADSGDFSLEIPF
jgi:hypothetical protein